jgi:hypothetical protein
MTKLTTRQECIIDILRDRPGSSTNYLFTRTSPACVARGLTRTIGTYGWKGMEALEKLGLVRCQKKYLRRDCRNRAIYQTSWFLTPAGEVLAQEEYLGWPWGQFDHFWGHAEGKL